MLSKYGTKICELPSNETKQQMKNQSCEHHPTKWDHSSNITVIFN